MSLTYEPASEPLHTSVKWLFLNQLLPSCPSSKQNLTHYLWSGLCAMVKLRREANSASSTLEITQNHHDDYTNNGSKRFRGGLVFKAHRLCSSLNSRLEITKEDSRRRSTREAGFELRLHAPFLRQRDRAHSRLKYEPAPEPLHISVK